MTLSRVTLLRDETGNFQIKLVASRDCLSRQPSPTPSSTLDLKMCQRYQTMMNMSEASGQIDIFSEANPPTSQAPIGNMILMSGTQQHSLYSRESSQQSY